MGKSLDITRTSLLNLCLIIMLVSRWHFFTRVRCSFVQIQRHTYPVIGHCLCIESIWSLLISECLAWELIHLPLETNFTKENNFHRRNDFQMGWSETPVDFKKKRIDHELIAYDWNLFHRVIAVSVIFSPLMYTHDQYCTWMWNLPSVQHLVFGVDFNQLSYEVTQVWTQGQVINADRT